MIKFVFKLVKIAVILLIIAALFVGFCYVGDEFLDIDFCDEVIDEIEDIFANESSESGEKNKNDGVFYEVLPEAYDFREVDEIGEEIAISSSIERVMCDMGGAELVSGATGTSKRLVESL